MTNGIDVLATAAGCRGLLEPALGANWSVRVPGVDFTVGPTFCPLLVYSDDAARGLGLSFAPDPALAGRVLARLFPWHACGRGDDPWRLLQWANGRIDLLGRPTRRTGAGTAPRYPTGTAGPSARLKGPVAPC